MSCHSRSVIPHPIHAGAGLGGGSGNAATALWAANELTGRPASNADLLAWSGEIGSDISVFFSDGAAYCTGRYTADHLGPALFPAVSPMLCPFAVLRFCNVDNVCTGATAWSALVMLNWEADKAN